MGFSPRLAARLVVLLASLAVVAWLITRPDLRAVTLVAGGIVAIQVALLIRFVDRANRELARLLGAIGSGDFAHSFTVGELGSSFGELGRAFEEVLRRFRDARLSGEARRGYLEALIEQVPVALLSVHDDGTVELMNSAARRLLNASSRTTLDALHAYGATFQRDVAQSRPGSRTLTRTLFDGVERHLILSTAEITVQGVRRRVTSLQDIQSELDTNELGAWQDLVRVISHEIMSSLTPIASLARTAEEMVKDLGDGPAADPETLADLRDALETLARRSDGLLRFVTSYRQLAQMPPPSLRSIPLRTYLRRLERLVAADWSRRGIRLELRDPPEGIELMVDEGLLDLATTNVLRNAADAASGRDDPRVWLSGGISERGRPVIEIADNGAGFPDEIRDKIFLPFFTTKADGSGIGLAVARQVMLIHKGAITASARPGGGALFRLVF